LAPPLFNVEQFGGVPNGSRVRRFMDSQAMSSRVKQCGKGSSE